MEDQDQRTAYDKILTSEEGSPIETAGAWESLTKGLGFDGEEELAHYIEGKTVLDVGSGMGGLFKEAKIRDVDTRIVNINPRFAIKGFAEEAHEMYELMADDLPDDIKAINKAHNKSATAAMSDQLPIKDSSVDVVIDNKAAVYHCLYEDTRDVVGITTTFKPNPKALEKTIQEYQRVLKLSGKARIGGLLDEPKEGVELLQEVLKTSGASYTEIKDVDGDIVAVEINKD